MGGRGCGHSWMLTVFGSSINRTLPGLRTESPSPLIEEKVLFVLGRQFLKTYLALQSFAYRLHMNGVRLSLMVG
jgi:hypothetical protein